MKKNSDKRNNTLIFPTAILCCFGVFLLLFAFLSSLYFPDDNIIMRVGYSSSSEAILATESPEPQKGVEVTGRSVTRSLSGIRSGGSGASPGKMRFWNGAGFKLPVLSEMTIKFEFPDEKPCTDIQIKNLSIPVRAGPLEHFCSGGVELFMC